MRRMTTNPVVHQETEAQGVLRNSGPGVVGSMLKPEALNEGEAACLRMKSPSLVLFDVFMIAKVGVVSLFRYPVSRNPSSSSFLYLRSKGTSNIIMKRQVYY
jgi:hypothetical protein